MRAFLGPKYREIHDQSLDITCMPDSSLYIICVFYSSRIRTLVAMVTLSFHRLIMGKVEISYFLKTIAA